MKAYLLTILCILPTLILSAQSRYDVVIDEIMADPAPPAGLPNQEWIELKNISGTAFNLQGWRLSDKTGQSGSMPFFILQPDSFVIICSNSALTALSIFGPTVSVASFPSLDNEGDQIILKASNSTTIHAVDFSSSWYGNELKKAGGWTLEMIDPKNPCSGSTNWKAAMDTKGGTPGKLNSVHAVNADAIPPQLKNAYALDSSTIVLVYNEPVDSISGTSVLNYSIDGGMIFSNASMIPPLFNQVELRIVTPLQENRVYSITVSNVMDCKGNLIDNGSKIKAGRAVDADEGELIINEILFNPAPNGYDYIEIYNRSNRIVDAAGLYIANRNSANIINSITRLSPTPFYIFPGEYRVITEDADNLGLHYLVRNPGSVLTISSLPSYPDEKGFVILLNGQGEIIDEVDYDDSWHFKLLNNDEGVSLERIDPGGSSRDAANWHSAASSAGYGTPGYKNSQYKNPVLIAAAITIVPAVFSPDNDGVDDVARIQYQMEEPGYVANITIFDGAGRPVKNLVRNGIMGNSGYWNWDGLNEKGQRLATGIYIILTEIFNLQGRKERFKNVIVLGRKLG